MGKSPNHLHPKHFQQLPPWVSVRLLVISKVAFCPVFTLAHLSDIHLSPLPRARRRHLLSKRILGYVNWHRGRKYVHRREILDLLTRDLVEQNPDHVAVTGDLVNLGLPEEYLRAADWLHHLGAPSEVTAIPGNHDAYVRGAVRDTKGRVSVRPPLR